ncbi:MAG: 3-deoxy-7-phosphoheptulonate synthase [Vampirovibrio sp.]|nr:3-deoxy-7-phosphoheptulonate synthase [Vampirovibrio sp.]
MKDLRQTLRKPESTEKPSTSAVSLNETTQVGGNQLALIAGPCAVESLDQVMEVAIHAKQLNIPCLRGGAFKPRTSPYSFQGMGLEGLEHLDQVRKTTGMAVISEVMSVEQMNMAQPYLDCFQIGARNMQNFELLKELGKQKKPVILKRGLSSTVEEFLYSAEYIMAEGNPNVILCERGIRSFDNMTRNVLDLGAVALLKELTHLPVLVDPSHATGKRSLVIPAARAGVAIGADGILVEAHPIPEKSVSDAAQALSLDDLTQLMKELEPVANAIGKSFFENQAASKAATTVTELETVSPRRLSAV